MIYALPFNDPNDDGEIAESELLWTFEFDSGGLSIASTPTEVVATRNGFLFCIDRASGELIWETGIYTHEEYPNPVIAHNKIFFSGGTPKYHWSLFTVFSSYPSDFPNASLKIKEYEYYTLTPIKFDASNSTDDVGELKYRLTFGDGYNTTWVDDPIFYYEYQKLGVYNVDVLVKDIHGFTNRSRAKVTIKNRIPNLPIFKDKKIKEIEYIKLKNLGDQIYDLDGKVIFFELDFGEGRPVRIESEYGINLSRITYYDYEYHGPGKYTVTITVKDDDGAINTTSFKVTVEEKLFYEHVLPEYRLLYFGICPGILIVAILLIVFFIKTRKKKKLS
jgi:hypothetical protein